MIEVIMNSSIILSFIDHFKNLVNKSFDQMVAMFRFRKICFLEPGKSIETSEKSTNIYDEQLFQSPKVDNNGEKVMEKPKKKKSGSKKNGGEWRKIDTCCWLIGYLITTWGILMFVMNLLPSGCFLLRVPETPGAILKREGLTALHPVILVPGIVTGGLELWEGKPCAENLFRKRLWGGSFTEIFRRPKCWMEHLSLDNETGLDPPGIRVRAVPGLVAADYFAPGYFVWAVLIENLAKIGYEGKNLHMAAYDWRISFQNTEVRDQSLSRLKSRIEQMYVSNGNKKVVVVPHSMGAIYFLHFLKWVESPPPMGGGGGPGWCAKHVKAIMNIAPAFLGVPKAVGNILSAEGKDVAYIRAMAPGIWESEALGLQTLHHVMRVSRTWDSVISLVPKGGETIWGNLDWAPEEEHECNTAAMTPLDLLSGQKNANNTNITSSYIPKELTKYGRIVSFGKAASEIPSSQLPTLGHQDFTPEIGPRKSNDSCEEVWSEYDEMSREGIRKVAENKAYTATTLIDILRFIAPKMMQRAEQHFSHGIAENLDDPKYNHYKYWSNPLETKLPIAPDMEIYALYGIGIPTERSYVYKLSSSDKCKSIPFQIDSSADGGSNSCLKRGVYIVDGDDSVPVLSAGFMCAKGWRGTTRFNPSGIPTYIREYQHKRPSSLLEGRGQESGAHVDVMGNVAFIEDVMRVAAGATGEELGGDKIFSDIMKMSDKINIQL